MNEFFPPVAFHFSVNILSGDKMQHETSFQEVSGLEAEIEVDTVRSGGENSVVYNLPKNVKYSDLVLKRAMVSLKSDIYKWCGSMLNDVDNFRVDPKRIKISLLNEKQEPVCTWFVVNAYPVKWSLGALNAEKNELAIESITLKYGALRKG